MRTCIPPQRKVLMGIEKGRFFQNAPSPAKKEQSYLPANRARARPAAMPLAQAQCRL